ncbi:MAG TPA: class I SAM-dependent methyltransferase [Acidobacteriaceae bacterium]
MTSWLVKAIVQRGIAALPNPHYWNELLQDRVTHSLELTDEVFNDGLRNCQKYLERLQRYSPAAQNAFSVFELGTGWFPVVPVGLFLCGAQEIWTWDIVPHLKLDRLKLTIRRFLELEQKQKLQDHITPEPARLEFLREVLRRCESPQSPEPAELLDSLGIHYRLGNAGQSGLPGQSVNLIVSNVVFEYLSPEQLSETLREFRRIASPDSVMSHSIDLRDQYASFDSRITFFNFLRFSDRQWRYLNNPIIPLNRLRVSDYRRAFSESGFQMVDETNQQGDPSELARIPLAQRFRGYPVEDLLVLYTDLVAVPANL